MQKTDKRLNGRWLITDNGNEKLEAYGDDERFALVFIDRCLEPVTDRKVIILNLEEEEKLYDILKARRAQ